MLPQDKLDQEFYYGFTEEQLAARRTSCLNVTENDIVKVVDEYIYKAMLEDKSAKVIFGLKNNNLEGFVSRGWRVEKYFQDISLNIDYYNSSLDAFAEKIKKYH